MLVEQAKICTARETTGCVTNWVGQGGAEWGTRDCGRYWRETAAAGRQIERREPGDGRREDGRYGMVRWGRVT